MIDWYLNIMYEMNGMNGMNGMRGMKGITGFTYISFKRLAPRPIDMSNILME